MKQFSLSLATGIAVAALLVLAGAPSAQAATLCVNPGGTGGCVAKIGTAVTASHAGDTIRVAAGTYKEAVVIGKALSLIGDDPASTIINAAGQPNGISIDGLDNAKLSRVIVSGFTVEHANFEGILVTDVTAVTVWNNRVIGNDKSVQVGKGTCPGLPSWETSEGDDCGEGIHITGVNHSIIANNLVQGNTGGILISDDVGPTHDNQILGNTVQQNAYDCGITLASHPPAAVTKASTSLGVYQNTVANNLSTDNGRAEAGDGAGVGLFASVPGAKTYGNVVVGNTLTNNGLPGVTMHSHTPGQVLTDNVIIGNTISGNLADTEDAATPGKTGINVYGVSPATGTVILGNQISDEAVDIAVKTPALVSIHLNDLLSGIGVDNLGTAAVDASENWWGCVAGPNTPGCSKVAGSKVQSAPWLNSAYQ